ncbi:occludin/ELL domain-containing protein 1 [Macrotis lagotis]|uniref:occludin/ELL domain-containing protein 1 n=1 Tax=Macrotis lagotis TaxID=92651 RepID=UPI003D68CD47
MQTRVKYGNIHKATARPPQPQTQERQEGQSHSRGLCSHPHHSVSQVAGLVYSAHAPQRDEGKPPGARRGIARIKYSMGEELRRPPPAQSIQGIQSSGQSSRGLGSSPRIPASLLRSTQTITPDHHFVPHAGKKFLEKDKRGVPKGSSNPTITYCLPASPKNPGVWSQHQQKRPKKIVFEDELPLRSTEVTPGLGPKPDKGSTVSGPVLNIGPTPQPQLIPGYVLRYPAICNEVERRRYKFVFQDQHAEYQELRQEVTTAMAKFQELEALLATLPQPGCKEEARLACIRREFERKKRDPVFLEKQTRCDYLKRKLKHLKAQIRKYDEKTSQDGSVYF